MTNASPGKITVTLSMPLAPTQRAILRVLVTQATVAMELSVEVKTDETPSHTRTRK